MIIDEAIETLAVWKPERCLPPLAEELIAFKLGIEALKRLQENRHLDDTIDVSPLPGETEED